MFVKLIAVFVASPHEDSLSLSLLMLKSLRRCFSSRSSLSLALGLLLSVHLKLHSSSQTLEYCRGGVHRLSGRYNGGRLLRAENWLWLWCGVLGYLCATVNYVSLLFWTKKSFWGWLRGLLGSHFGFLISHFCFSFLIFERLWFRVDEKATICWKYIPVCTRKYRTITFLCR